MIVLHIIAGAIKSGTNRRNIRNEVSLLKGPADASRALGERPYRAIAMFRENYGSGRFGDAISDAQLRS